MKKFLSTLTAAVCVMACAFSFAACGGDNSGGDKTHTTHNWSATYTQDGVRHYQTCNGCNEKQYSNHDYGANGVCVCGKEKPVEIHTHNWSTTYTQDGDRHYQTCDGCNEKQYNNHDYGASGVCVCGKQKPVTVIAVESVTLNKTAITLEIDEMETLTATLTPDNATDKTVTWTVAPAGVVSVDDNGNVTAIKDGTATITATANGKSATCSVTVNAPLTNADVLKFLNDNVLLNAAKDCLNSSWEVNNENVINPTWYITKDGKNITGANLVFTYIRRDTAHYQTLCNIDFAKPLTIQNIRNNEISISTFSQIYTKAINPIIQAEHNDLTNAICDKLFGEKTNAARYIIDLGRTSTNPQYGDAVSFTVIEIIDIYVKEKSLTISDDGDDIKLIENINNSKYYTYGEEKNVAIAGEKLENNSAQFFGNSAD